jgi:hypothetical protein
MDTARNEFFARTGRPENKQRMIGGSNPIDHADQLAKRWCAAYERA